MSCTDAGRYFDQRLAEQEWLPDEAAPTDATNAAARALLDEVYHALAGLNVKMPSIGSFEGGWLIQWMTEVGYVLLSVRADPTHNHACMYAYAIRRIDRMPTPETLVERVRSLFSNATDQQSEVLP